MVLRVPFSGAAPITATWSFNGNSVSGGKYKVKTTSRESTLTLENFQEQDCGTYEVTMVFQHKKATNVGSEWNYFLLVEIYFTHGSIVLQCTQHFANALEQIKVVWDPRLQLLKRPFLYICVYIYIKLLLTGSPNDGDPYKCVLVRHAIKRRVLTFTNSRLQTDCILIQVYLKNQYGDMRIPVNVSLSETSKVSFETVSVPGETVQKTSTMVISQGK